MADWEQDFYGKDMRVTTRQDDCTIYRLKDENGESVFTRYQVYPGVSLVYNDVHTQNISIDKTNTYQNILEINHCREGRIEFESADGEYVYIKKGDMAINTKSRVKNYSYFPQCHYHGVTIEFNLDELMLNPVSAFSEFKLCPDVMKERFCKDYSCFVLHEKKEFEHLFAELYCVPEKIRKRYYKIKILEILLFVSAIDTEHEHKEKRYFNKEMVAAAKEAHGYMISHIDQKITIDFLSKKFGISPTSLKKCFREVYGNSIYASLKEYRIHEAVLLLRNTELDISEIAGRVGYDNASKFAGSFKSVIGINPKEFRKNV